MSHFIIINQNKIHLCSLTVYIMQQLFLNHCSKYKDSCPIIILEQDSWENLKTNKIQNKK